jgi:hypothetical protein
VLMIVRGRTERCDDSMGGGQSDVLMIVRGEDRDVLMMVRGRTEMC